MTRVALPKRLHTLTVHDWARHPLSVSNTACETAKSLLCLWPVLEQIMIILFSLSTPRAVQGVYTHPHKLWLRSVAQVVAYDM
jgi:hypothetical protein